MPCNGGTSYCAANTARMGCRHFPYGCGVMRNGDALQPGDCVYNPRYRNPADAGDGPEGGTLVLQEDGNLAIYANSDGGHQAVETTGTNVAEGHSGTGIAYFAPDGDLVTLTLTLTLTLALTLTL